MTALGQSHFLQALGSAVLNSLWQLAFLWVLYQIITALFKVKKSSAKASLATGMLFTGFAWFLVTLIGLLGDTSDVVSYYVLPGVEGNGAANSWLSTSLPIASVIYLVLLLLPIMNFVRNYRYVQTIRRHAISKADVQWRMFVRRVAAQMGIRKPVHVYMSELVSSPVTIGYLKPVILLPLATINHLSIQQMEAVLLHELSHIKRYDYFLNLISRFIQTLLYFNPFVKAFCQVIEREREKSCDEMVIQFQYEPHGYASALLTLEKAASIPTQSLAVAAAGVRKNELLGRIESILGIEKKATFSFNKLAGVMAAILCFISLNALLLWSQPRTASSGNGILSHVSSPFLFFGDENESETPSFVKTEAIKDSENNVRTETAVAFPKAIKDLAPAVNAFTDESPVLLPVQFAADRELVLDKEQEKLVRVALEGSRKVLEDVQWKAVERSIADALTIAEKTQVKELYEEAAENVNWQGMENKLRQEYDKINWAEVQTSLGMALSEIKLDSLQHAYNLALVNLSELQKEMVKTNQKSVPDTDLTLKTVEQKKRQVEKVTDRLKHVRTRKVVQL